MAFLIFFYRTKATCWAKKTTYFASPISFWAVISTDVESTSSEFLITGKLLNPTKSSTMRRMSNQFHQNFDINKYQNSNLIRRHHAMVTMANKHVQWGNVHIFYNIHFSPKYSKYFHNIVTVLNKSFFLKRAIRVLINTWIWTLISTYEHQGFKLFYLCNLQLLKRDLISECILTLVQSLKKVANHYPQLFNLKSEKLKMVIWHIFREGIIVKIPPENKPPLFSLFGPKYWSNEIV